MIPLALALQVISWSHAVTTTTSLTVGLRLEPVVSRAVDSKLRRWSPYGNALRTTGQPTLPETRLTSPTTDVQYLRWLGVGDWHGPRIVTQAFWFPVGYIGARLTNGALSVAAMATYTGVRTAVIPTYHFDPLGYAASIGSWGVAGAYLGNGGRDWRVPLGLSGIWLLTYPWATPVPSSR